MGNLLDKYNNLLTSGNAYYYRSSGNSQSFEKINFKTIKQYFSAGGKDKCIPKEVSQYYGKSKQQQRCTHIFSVFLLGVWCYENIAPLNVAANKLIVKMRRNYLKNQCKKNKAICKETDNNEAIKRDFLYVWFLTALFHDMGYFYEDQKDNDNSIYTRSLLSKKLLEKKCLKGQKRILGIPSLLCDLVFQYMYVRRTTHDFGKDKCVDHGFVGGLLLYQRLKRLHKNKDNGILNDVESGCLNDNGLEFNPGIFKYFNIPCAWAIICHNIWLGNMDKTSDFEIYNKHDAGKLLYKLGQSPIILSKHPLLFLLDFVDTIEPCKRFRSHSSIDILKKMNINMDNSTSRLTISCDFADKMLSDKINDVAMDLSFLYSREFFQEKNTTEANRITLNFALRKDDKHDNQNI